MLLMLMFQRAVLRPMRRNFLLPSTFLPPPPLLLLRRGNNRHSSFRIMSTAAQQCSQQPPPSPLKNKTTRRKEARRRRHELNMAMASELERLRKTQNLLTIKVSIPYEARVNCKLSHQLKRSRVFIPQTTLTNFTTFKTSIYHYLLRLYPEINSSNNLTLLPNIDSFTLHHTQTQTPITSLTTLNTLLKPPQTISDIHITIQPHTIPGGLPPLPPKLYTLQQTSLKTPTLQMISFYKFTRIKNPQHFSSHLKRVFILYSITGRIYVAHEGVNAQLSVPTNIWGDFVKVMRGDLKWDVEYWDVPKEILGVFLNWDVVVGVDEVPFRDLRVLERKQVLSDGLGEELMLDNGGGLGKEVEADVWHEKLGEGGMENGEVVVLDCRNKYESEVGVFEGAKRLDTRTFKESWDWLEKELKGVDRGKKIMTYCTGGIRCVKVNAYLEQRMGFKDTERLAGGIVSYARMLRERGRLEESRFKGVNHVFDARLGERITDDVLSRCYNCGLLASTQTDCSNPKCRRPFDTRLFIQCPDCATSLAGACSESCRDVVLADKDKLSGFAGLVVDPKDDHVVVKGERSDKVCDEAYASAFSEEEPQLLREVREFTMKKYPQRAHMISGSLQGGLLKLLVASIGAKRVLEIGTFTGYSGLYMASGLPADGRLITCEIDNETAEIAQSFFDRDPELGRRIELRIGPGLTSLRELRDEKDRPLENMEELSESKCFDFAYVDANKKSYRDYYEMLIGHGLLRVGGVMVLDNVLFRGRVAEGWMNSVSAGEMSDVSDDDDNESSDDSSNSKEGLNGTVVYSSVDQRRRLKSLENAKKIAHSLHEFNKFVAKDPRTEHVVLPIRDGATILRRIS